jgi:hypothetical protein
MNRTGKRNKKNSNGKERSQTIPICDDMILPKRPNKQKLLPKLLAIINTFSKVTGYKIKTKKQYPFYMPIMNRLGKNL